MKRTIIAASLVVFALMATGKERPVECVGNQVHAKSETVEEAKDLDIYLLIGQSNMAGRAEITSHEKDTLEGVFIFTGNAEEMWEKAANPLNKYSTIRKSISMQKLGPGYAFAKQMRKGNGSRDIGLVVNAKGGSKIEEWKPGSKFYNEAVARTREALKSGRLKGIVWHQGESNATKLKDYMEKLQTLIAELRKDLNAPNVPFVAGQLSEDKDFRKAFNVMILELPELVETSGVVKSKRTATIDETHFNTKSQLLMGKRFAKKMKALQK
ncbi:sialate O-acetylesterase [Puteibacter caeruleilacunae]|nr:sialate O-acetylesterase [Puteibacter caeruleilacunae]